MQKQDDSFTVALGATWHCVLSVSPRAPPPVHRRRIRRLCPRILDSGPWTSAEDTVITHGQWQTQCRPFENSISDRPSGGNPTCFGWWGKPALQSTAKAPRFQHQFFWLQEAAFLWTLLRWPGQRQFAASPWPSAPALIPLAGSSYGPDTQDSTFKIQL